MRRDNAHSPLDRTPSTGHPAWQRRDARLAAVERSYPDGSRSAHPTVRDRLWRISIVSRPSGGQSGTIGTYDPLVPNAGDNGTWPCEFARSLELRFSLRMPRMVPAALQSTL
jgi:hypothetical protein